MNHSEEPIVFVRDVSVPEELCYRCHEPADKGKTLTLITCPCGCSFDACQTCVDKPVQGRYVSLTDWAASLSHVHLGTGRSTKREPPEGGCGRKVDLHWGPHETITCIVCKG